jgi:hypothetical protein
VNAEGTGGEREDDFTDNFNIRPIFIRILWVLQFVFNAA